jgi:hypothetical protein
MISSGLMEFVMISALFPFRDVHFIKRIKKWHFPHKEDLPLKYFHQSSLSHQQ